MTDISVTSPIERVARVLAAESISINAHGDVVSAGGHVNAAWRGELGRAVAVLRTLREATPEMIEAGRAAGNAPAEIWSAMVNTAIAEAREMAG